MNALATVYQFPTDSQHPAATSAQNTLTSFAVSIPEMKQQVNLIQHIMKEVMKNGEHFGVIPGCGDKPALLKPGAEKLMLTFRLANDVDTDVIDMQNGHREYRVKVTLFSPTGQRLGTGVGSCSTMESKYRFRTGPTELTSREVPKKYWDLRKEDPAKAQEVIGGRGFAAKKGPEGRWMIAVQGEKVEHDNPADYYNTVLKMAKKRALVDAVLTSTAASDIFTQDIEDAPELYSRPVVNPSQQTPATSSSPVIDDPEFTVVEPVSNAHSNIPVENIEAILAELNQNQIKYSIRDNIVAATLHFDDVNGRKLVKSHGFNWDGKAKAWIRYI